MDDTSSSSRLLGGSGSGRRSTEEPSPTDTPLYTERQANQTNNTHKILHLAVVSVVLIMVLITAILSIYISATRSQPGLYIILGLSVLLLAAIEVIMVKFVRSGDLPREKTWFLYAVGGCIVLEALFTDILLFQ